MAIATKSSALQHLKEMLDVKILRMEHPEMVSPEEYLEGEPSAKQIRLAIKHIEEDPRVVCDYCNQFALRGLLCPDPCPNS